MSYSSAWAEMAPIALLLGLVLFAVGLPIAFLAARRWRRGVARVAAAALLVALLAGAIAARDRNDAEPFYTAAGAIATAAAAILGLAFARPPARAADAEERPISPASR